MYSDTGEKIGVSARWLGYAPTSQVTVAWRAAHVQVAVKSVIEDLVPGAGDVCRRRQGSEVMSC